MKKFIFYTIILILYTFILNTHHAIAASLFFSPSSGSYRVGSTFKVGVYVASPDQAMNAASGQIEFPTDKLEVVNLSKNGSIFNFWVQEPSFSNSEGRINFEGVVFNPGFTGTNGKILEINFRAKSAGTAEIRFSSGIVLANDGQGTNILKDLGLANFYLSVAPEEKPKAVYEIIPKAPQISSPTHPDQNKWYSNNSPKFVWKVPNDVNAVRVLIGQKPDAVPPVLYEPPISEREVKNLPDGIWYFSVQFRNNDGWSEIGRYKVQIDTTKPAKFEIKEVERNYSQVKFVFDAYDETSGIDYYEVQLGDKEQVTSNNEFITDPLPPGRYALIAKAFDKAGNFLINSIEFTLEGLEPPQIISYPKTLNLDEILVVKGITKYKASQINVYLQRENEEPKVYQEKADNEGIFIFVNKDKLDYGVYNLWAEVVDGRGSKSGPSEKVTFAVKPSELVKISSKLLNFFTVFVPLLALILLLIYLVYYWWHKFTSLRKRVKKEAIKAEEILHKQIDSLKESLRAKIKTLEETKSKRHLTEEEERIFEELKKDLDRLEKILRKEIEDIEKGI